MKASIIITTYKRNKFLIQAIQSCLNQDFTGEKEIIVVDDSGINTSHQIKNQKNLNDQFNGQIKYIAHKINKGACVARNTGAENAAGEYLFFLDDDDEFLPNKVSEQISFLEKNKEYDAYASAFLKKRNGKDFPSTDGQPVIGDFKHFMMYGNVYTPMLCIKKEAFFDVGGFHEIPKFQDMYFVCLLLDSGKKIYSGKEPLFVQNDHKQERISNKSVINAKVAVNKIQELAIARKNLFTTEEWKSVEARLALLLATTYYSSTYTNRIKSIKYWQYCYKVSKDKKYLPYIVKSFVPNGWIKTMEGRKK